MKKILSISLLVCTLSLFTACNFLDVYPDDRLIQEQIVSSEIALNYVLNGIYMAMANNNSYGAALTTTIVECLAQRYNLSHQDHAFRDIGAYDYSQERSDRIFFLIWERMYVQILAINDFMGLLNSTTLDIPDSRKHILLGEAHALRAMHHFDLLRLFGPVYRLNPELESIPYNNSGEGISQRLPLLSAKEVMEKVIEDLEIAENYLRPFDPIRTQGIVRTQSYDPLVNFFRNRQLRMNYYAVRALQARAWLWIGENEKALEAAKAVIDAPLVQSGRLFPWTPFANISRSQDPDRIFSSEVIFGIRNREMYNNFNRWFAGTLQSSAIFNPNARRLHSAFENNRNDYRYTLSTWLVPPGVEREPGDAIEDEIRTSHKFAQPTNISAMDTVFAYFQPLIRISEMYYIAAEALVETDPVTATQYLETVRRNRGLANEVLPENLMDEIRKEYIKEFWGEGQLFFFYKRTNQPTIPDGNTSVGDRPMTPARYRVPLPLREVSLR